MTHLVMVETRAFPQLIFILVLILISPLNSRAAVVNPYVPGTLSTMSKNASGQIHLSRNRFVRCVSVLTQVIEGRFLTEGPFTGWPLKKILNFTPALFRNRPLHETSQQRKGRLVNFLSRLKKLGPELAEREAQLIQDYLESEEILRYRPSGLEDYLFYRFPNAYAVYPATDPRSTKVYRGNPSNNLSNVPSRDRFSDGAFLIEFNLVEGLEVLHQFDLEYGSMHAANAVFTFLNRYKAKHTENIYPLMATIIQIATESRDPQIRLHIISALSESHLMRNFKSMPHSVEWSLLLLQHLQPKTPSQLQDIHKVLSHVLTQQAWITWDGPVTAIPHLERLEELARMARIFFKNEDDDLSKKYGIVEQTLLKARSMMENYWEEVSQLNDRGVFTISRPASPFGNLEEILLASTIPH